ncbi:hypothetical protein KCU83_g230, partial [Aureobasidium melanogenum]
MPAPLGPIALASLSLSNNAGDNPRPLLLNNRKVMQCRTSDGLLLTQPPPYFAPCGLGLLHPKKPFLAPIHAFLVGLWRLLGVSTG